MEEKEEHKNGGNMEIDNYKLSDMTWNWFTALLLLLLLLLVVLLLLIMMAMMEKSITDWLQLVG